MVIPDWRVTVPVLGSMSPVISLNSVVLPVPFRPTMPHRSPALTVKVMSRNRVVAPKSTPAPPTEIWVIPLLSPPACTSWGEPALPRLLRRADRERVRVAYKRHLQKQGLVDQDRQPPLVAIPRRSQPQVAEPLRALIDKRRGAELLREAHQLAARCCPFSQVHEVRTHSTLGEEAQRLARFRALLRAEDLNVHACRVDIMKRRDRKS